MTWVEKHRPACFLDVKGQDEAISKIKNFIEDFNIRQIASASKVRRGKKALLLYGPPGTGKTTLAHVAAIESNSELFELNASDLRNKKKLDEVLKPAIEQHSLVKKGKIILIDEVDGISGFADKGGIQELLNLIYSTNYPVIITANDAWSKKLSPLRKQAELIQLKEIPYTAIKDVMICILRKEGKFIPQEILNKIAAKANGDLRAAINDLQAISKLKDPKDALKFEYDERNKEIDIFNALKQVFKGKPSNEILGIYDSVNMPIDEIILWIEENIPAEYSGEELARAYESLSKVDLFKGRIYKQQYWRFLVYENAFLSFGISASKSAGVNSKRNSNAFTKYKKPSRILKIWLNNQRIAKKKSISQKYAKYVHVGQKRAMKEFPIIKQIINSNPLIAQELKLDEDEMAYLRK